METKEFLDFAKATVDLVASYTESLRTRNVLPDVEPGYLSRLIPDEAPEEAEDWQKVLEDVQKLIIPGVTHWNSPHFHAYYPTANSYPAIVGELLSAGIGCIGFSWICSPVCTELEVVTMNWLGKMLGLPDVFLNCSDGPGGGVIQGSASEATLVCLLAAKEKMTRRMKTLHPEMDEALIKSKMTAYTSDQSNSSVEKSGILASVPMRLLPVDEKCSLRGETLLKAIKEDLEKGFIPCYVVATLGTTGTCAFDNLQELGSVCNEYNLWLHVDAAYAGAAFICPEYRYLMDGVEMADSFNFNPHKWLLVNFDCSALWVRDSRHLLDAFSVDRIYLSHDKMGLAPDYRNWQIPLGRRFRSLKLWFVLRLYGAEGLRTHIKKTIRLGKKFEEFVKADGRFQLVSEASMGLVCFRMRGEDSLTKDLLAKLTTRKKIYVVAATLKGQLIVRFVVGSRLCEEEDLDFAWKEITEQAVEVLKSRSIAKPLDIATRIATLNLETKNASQKIS